MQEDGEVGAPGGVEVDEKGIEDYWRTIGTVRGAGMGVRRMVRMRVVRAVKGGRSIVAVGSISEVVLM